MLRDIIEIDESLCTGCGDCVPACHEGALQIIDGKARLISDLMCDGLGACLGECPTGAMQVVQREAVPYDERVVMENIVKGGEKVIKAHLQHMLDHNELEYYQIALQVLQEKGISAPELSAGEANSSCPGSKNIQIETQLESEQGEITSQLSHWPIQLHLINPTNPDFQGADLLLAADCSAFAAGDFHQTYLKGKKLLIACPKLDTNQESYVEKLGLLLRFGQLKSLTILRMDVPCCGGLEKLTEQALSSSRRKLDIKVITINKTGQVV